MAGQSIGSAALIIKANASQLDSTLKKKEQDIKKFAEKSGSSLGGLGKAALAAAAAISVVNFIRNVGDAVDKQAKKQRELNELLGHNNELRQEARNLGLLLSDEDNAQLQKAANNAATIDRAWKRFEENVGSFVLNIPGIGEGIKNLAGGEVDLAKQEAFMKKAQKITEATKSMQEELARASASIGKTADQTKLWELAQKGVNAQTIVFFKLHMRMNEIRKFTEDLNTSMANLGKTTGRYA